MSHQTRQIDQLHLSQALQNDRAERYAAPQTKETWSIFKITQGADAAGLYRGKRQKLNRDNQLVDHADTAEYCIGCPTGSSLAVDQKVLARLDNCQEDGTTIFNVWGGASTSGLYKITGGPANIGGTYLYQGYKQKYSSGLSNDGGLVYLYFPNNTGVLPSGSSDVSGHYHTGLDLGWKVTVSEVVYPVIFCTGHLGRCNFVLAAT